MSTLRGLARLLRVAGIIRSRPTVLADLRREWRAGVRAGLGREPTPAEWARLGTGPRE